MNYQPEFFSGFFIPWSMAGEASGLERGGKIF